MAWGTGISEVSAIQLLLLSFNTEIIIVFPLQASSTSAVELQPGAFPSIIMSWGVFKSRSQILKTEQLGRLVFPVMVIFPPIEIKLSRLDKLLSSQLSLTEKTSYIDIRCFNPEKNLKF